MDGRRRRYDLGERRQLGRGKLFEVGPGDRQWWGRVAREVGIEAELKALERSAVGHSR